jgi:hypothetical protein
LASNEVPDHRCRSISKAESGIDLPVALHPNMAKPEVLKMLGKPTLIRGSTFYYCHSHREVIDGKAYDASNSVALVFRGSKVWAIDVVKTTSN